MALREEEEKDSSLRAACSRRKGHLYTGEKVAARRPGREPVPEASRADTALSFRLPETLGNELLLFRPPGLRYSVTAADADSDTPRADRLADHRSAAKTGRDEGRSLHLWMAPSMTESTRVTPTTDFTFCGKSSPWFSPPAISSSVTYSPESS